MAKFKKNKLFYKNPKTLPENNGHGLFAFKVKGVEKFQSNNPDKGVPKVKLLFELGHNGVILLKKAKAFYENSTTNIDSKASSAKRKKGENSTKKNETNVVSADLDVSFFDGFEKNGDLFDRESLESAIKMYF